MHIDPLMVLAAAVVGFLVGMTGMGGGALMTPMLVLVFGVSPSVAISSDLVAAIVMKPMGGLVHLRRGTVNLGLVKWLALGSVPAAFCGVFVLPHLGGKTASDHVRLLLGGVLVAGAVAVVAKAWVQRLRSPVELGSDGADGAVVVMPRRVATVAIGTLVGLMVGLTSVGSGSFMVVALLALYPMMRLSDLVGTDLVQAIPLTGSAALAHVLFGHVSFGISASLVIGGVPAVYLGARVSSRAPDRIIRPVLSTVLVASGLKLLGLSNLALVLVLAVAVVTVLVGGRVLAARGERAIDIRGDTILVPSGDD